MKIILTDKAPAAIGPYSQAVVTGNLVYASGQIPVIPSKGTLAEGDITVQAELACKNVGTILAAAGTSFENLPDDWTCPLCSVGKDMFEVEE